MILDDNSILSLYTQKISTIKHISIQKATC